MQVLSKTDILCNLCVGSVSEDSSGIRILARYVLAHHRYVHFFVLICNKSTFLQVVSYSHHMNMS